MTLATSIFEFVRRSVPVKVSTRSLKRSIGVTHKTATHRAINPLLPALLAIGGAAILSAKPASGIELGQLQINSTLGQPFNASIAYVLNPHEELYSYCVSLNRGYEPGVQSLTHAKVSVIGSRIILTGDRPINEPMLALRVTVNCPYTVKLARSYMVMINPAGTTQAIPQGQLSLPEVRSTATATMAPLTREGSEPTPAVAQAPRQLSATPASNNDESPIYVGDSYRVQNGDTLSKIANRIDSRPVGLWPAIDAIYQANREAFVGNDKNHLMAGSLLSIPAMDGYEIVADVAEVADEPEYIAPVEAEPTYAGESTNTAETSYVTDTGTSYQTYDSGEQQWGEVVADDDVNEYSDEYYVGDTESAPVDESAFQDDTAVLSSGDLAPVADTAGVNDEAAADEYVPVAEPVDETASDEFAAAQPGDVFAGADTAVESSVETVISEPLATIDTPVESEATTPPVAVAKPLSESPWYSQSWLMWAGGGALALILGLGLFGRKILGLSGDDPEERTEPVLEDEDEITQKSQVLSDIDFQLDDTSSGEHAMELDADLGAGIGLEEKERPEIAFAETTELDAAIAATATVDAGMELDADLGAGTGLQDGTDLDVAQDFGFSATGENAAPLDLEIPVEVEVEAEEMPTDIIPPSHAEEKSILDAEVKPAENDDDSQYDLSMIVDVTKQALGEADATAKDLMAVQLDAAQPNIDDSAYTLSKEVDFKILEQDYEEELTQTQAVNEEIARAAMELAERMETEDDVLDVTVDMPAQSKVPAQNDEVIGDADATLIDDPDATALNEELTINEDATVEMDPKNRAG